MLLLPCLFWTWAVIPPAIADTPSLTAPLAPLGHGLNLGNFLEAPFEGAWDGNRLLMESDFSAIHQAGFTHVRVPICWSAHVSATSDATIDPVFLSRVDWVVAQAGQNQLQVILDYQSDSPLMANPEANEDRFMTTWKQIAAHYKDAPPSVLFELLNEPNGKLDATHWNDLLAKTLAIVRETNPGRTVVVGPALYNQIRLLPQLVLPAEDHHLVVAVHFYDPMPFTHQGASWVPGSDAWLGTKWTGSPEEQQAVTAAFDQAADWSKAQQRPVYLGEFGSYEKGDFDSRVRWTSFVARTAEAHGFPWAYWEYCAGFGVYDPKAQQWHGPLSPGAFAQALILPA